MPKEVALARLNEVDPKSNFRAMVINETYDFFYRTKYKLPGYVQERIISIDSSKSIDEVFDEIVFYINKNFNMLIKHKKL